MDIEKIPVLGMINKKINAVVINFAILGIITLTLGIVIPFFPQVLTLLASIFLIVASALLFSTAYHIHSTKKKYTKWIED